MPEMLGNVLKNLFSRPSTRKYPYEKREPFEAARGHIAFLPEKCIYCGACARRCPAVAITVKRAEKELLFDPYRCVICEACAEVCPKQAIEVIAGHRTPAYRKGQELYTTPKSS
jgi:ech hydrogenase subunit F